MYRLGYSTYSMSGKVSPTVTEELLSHSVDVITVLDEFGIIQYESPSLQRIFGYEPADLVGDNVFQCIHPDDRQIALETFSELIDSAAGERTERVELRFRHNDGGWIWVETRGINEKASEIGGYVVSSRDITERKEYECELEQERDRLERFASILSHDLRNPLNVAQGQLGFAQEECESEHLAAVARAHDRIEALIDGILAVTYEGAAEPQVDAVDLRTMGEACWQNVETKAATLTIEADQRLLADESQCQRILENLMRNAAEHGGDAVTVTIGTLEDGFYVEDDGRGLPHDAPETLLEDGFSTKEGGTGLGLSIVREIVESHEWQLRIQEGDDGGVRFEIRGVTFL